MAKKKAIPSIHVPIQTASGAMEFSWYMFMQWLAESATQSDLSNYFTKEETEALLGTKVDIVSEPNKIYGTDNNGNQYLYSASYFAVDDNVVHKTGSRREDITGYKSFLDGILVNGSVSVKNTENKNAVYMPHGLEFTPLTTNNFGGYLDFHYAGSTADYTSRIIEDASGQLTYSGAQRFASDVSGSSGVIATKGWVNLVGADGNGNNYNNVVHKNGDETISDTKTFTDDRPIWIKTPAHSGGSGIVITDSNSAANASIYMLHYKVSNGRYYARFLNSAYGVSAYIDVTVDSDGTRRISLSNTDYADVVTPTETTTSSKQIDTVGARNTALLSKAAIDLSNLNSNGKNISKWSTSVSNCVSGIPQDIKISLNSSNGTVTLAAGSKVYYPNGTGTFDAYPVPNNISRATWGTTAVENAMIFLNSAKSSMTYVNLDICSSDSTPPTTGVWYDTANNLVKVYYSGNLQETGLSFPIAIAKVNASGTIVKIKQVFNGFGFLGSVFFALPGVSYLIPNGRNDDGSLRSTALTLSGVRTISTTAYSNGMRSLCITSSGTLELQVSYNQINTEGDLPDSGDWMRYYCQDTNKVYTYISGVLTQQYTCFLGYFITQGAAPYKILSFVPKQAFDVLDRNDTSFIAHQATPSKKYISLTLGSTSPVTLTAPADGYFALSASFDTASVLYMYRSATPRIGISIPYTSGSWRDACLFVPKGGSVTFQFAGTPTVYSFNFIYAEGAK